MNFINSVVSGKSVTIGTEIYAETNMPSADNASQFGESSHTSAQEFVNLIPEFIDISATSDDENVS